MQSNRDDYFPALTGVRTFAACLVFFTHFNPFHELTWNGWPFRLAAEGQTGLYMFYVLSGFLIHYRYGTSERAVPLRSWGGYAVTRFGRIYPTYFLLLMLTYLVQGAPSSRAMLIQLTLTQAYFADYSMTGILQAWTLTIEETFYLTAPLIFLFMRRVPIWAILVGLLAFGTAIILVTGSDLFVKSELLGAAPSFACGIYLSSRISKRGVPPRQGFPWITYGAFAAIIAVHFGLAICRPTDGPWTVDRGFCFMMLLTMILPSVAGVWFYGLLTERSPIRWLLERRPIVIIGASSYVFYLVHMGVIQSFLLNVVGLPILPLFVSVTALGVLIHRLFEQPLTRWFRQLGKRLEGAPNPKPIRFRPLIQPALTLLAFVLVIVALRFGPTRNAVRSWSLAEEASSLVTAKDAPRKERYERAEKIYRAAVDEWPENVEALVQLARLRQHEGDHAEAISLLERAYEVRPYSPEANYYLAESLSYVWRRPEAEEHYRLAINRGRYARESLLKLGFLCRSHSQWDEAEECFRQVLALRPTNEGAALGLAEILRRKNRSDEARDVLQKVVDVRSDVPAVEQALSALPPSPSKP